MPACQRSYKSGPRDLIIDQKFYKKFIEETKIDVDYKTFRKVILDSNKEIANLVANYEGGFKLPENIGYIVVTKYKSKKKPIDWVNTKKLNRKILLTNLHSYGLIHHIKWYKHGITTFIFKDAYRFSPVRLLQREVAKNTKEGKMYSSWTHSDFWGKTKTFKKLYPK